MRTMLFTSFLVIYGCVGLVWLRIADAKRRRRLIDGILAGIDPLKAEGVTTTVLIETPRPRAGLGRFFRRTPIHESGGKPGFSQAGFALTTLAAAAAGAIVGSRFAGIVGPVAPLIGGLALGAVPWMVRSNRRNKRFLALEQQFPDALDFLARSIRAGNAFSIGLELLAAEVSEPLKAEILRLTREMALGASLEEGLTGLTARVPLVEVRFFVAAVLLQKETGGNLSEVLGKLAMSVRERLRLRGHVKAASGQGRLTARVLSVLPVATMLILRTVSPDYLKGLTGDPVGRNLLAAAVVSQVIGYFVMQRIIRIEV